ncbi:hypothetical protein K458DRAFT_374622 [Lentithecium fluviatile CBS 122367]|uniref:Mid2 domain-containing protein n=1 Tax=Lentithecium fluviatile CBS 122367 TaxID=1168545 RepID=A0A6G1IP85_9PLEO|nr:hypothetical protein K458DRAFT_374622 [Lentithecium fluviatile CBS 122367]
MLFARSLCASALAACVSLVAADASPMDVSVKAYNAPGMSTADTYRELRRGLVEAKLAKREGEADLKRNVSLEQYWEGATLLKISATPSDVSINVKRQNEPNKSPTENNDPNNQNDPQGQFGVGAGIEIICKKCYTKGIATFVLDIADDFNASQAVNATKVEFEDEVMNFTQSVSNYFTNYTKGVISKLGDGIDLADFAFPTFNYSFDLDIPAIPECNLEFEFDQMELYLEMETVFTAGSEYEYTLFTAQSPVGIGLGPNLMLGVVFSVDLILSVEGTLDMSSGIHIKLEDGIKIQIPLFSEEISNIVHNGGQFEFLPVTVESAGVVFTAALRIGIYSGLSLGAPKGSILDIIPGMPQMSGGLQVSVFANLAEFITNVSYVPNDPECEIKAVQEFQVALGAAAGMSVALDPVTWGPVAETKIPIWNTQLAEVCASKGTPRPTSPAPASASPTPTPTSSSAGNNKRQEMETTELKSVVTHTAVGCASSVSANCPVSLQQTAQSSETITTTLTYPSGSPAPTFPNATQTVIPTGSYRQFGSNVISIDKTSGSPTVYTPPPSKETGNGSGNEPGKTDSGLDGEVGGVSKKVIVGVSVGIGAALIIGAIAGFLLWKKKKRYGSVPHKFNDGRSSLVNEPYTGGSARFEPYRPADKAKGGITVTEMRR